MDFNFSPMRLFICKVASRCNLDCDYCYVYQHADQTWRKQPVKLSLETAIQLGKRIDEHAQTHNLRVVDLVMHGGEPLLLGVDYLYRLCETIQNNAPHVKICYRIQTNGVLFNEAALRFCLEWGITVGLSLDGPRRVNDLHRFDHKGYSSFDAVEQALKLLTSEDGRNIWNGFLTVIDIHNDPIEVYSYLKSFKPRMIEFLLPLGHYDLRPYGKESTEGTPYADWLLKIFSEWYYEKPQTIQVRRFRDIIALMAGSNYSSEEWGLQPVDFAVIETNGEIQAVDTLKITYTGANNLDLNIFDHSFDDMFMSPLVRERQARWSSLCRTCQECELVQVCGGGYFPHRYSHANGFQNPSIYCSDLTKLIHEIHATVMDDLSKLQGVQSQQEGKVKEVTLA